MFVADLRIFQAVAARDKIKKVSDEKINSRQFKRRILIFVMKNPQIMKIAKKKKTIILTQ